MLLCIERLHYSVSNVTMNVDIKNGQFGPTASACKFITARQWRRGVGEIIIILHFFFFFTHNSVGVLYNCVLAIRYNQ